VAQEDVPRLGQPHPSRRSDEERRSELVLEAADLSAHRRLRDAEGVRRASDVPFLGDRHEVMDLRQAHEVDPTRWRSRRQRRATPDPNGIGSRRPRRPRCPTMTVELYGPREIAALRRAGEAAAATLAFIGDRLRPGVTTADIDAWVREHTKQLGGTPSQLGYEGFPASVCTSRNHVVCHGIPRADEVLRPGDILNIDVTTGLGGFHGDTSATFVLGDASEEALHVVDVARRCRDAGIATIRDGARLGDIGAAVAELAERHGCSVVRDYGGHGIGRQMHMEPHVPHFGRRGSGLRLRAGMALTVEPMINLGAPEVRTLDDGWTVVTADGRLSAQFEHTVLVTREGVEIMTSASDRAAAHR
jgi:methionyl aminopeptidase